MFLWCCLCHYAMCIVKKSTAKPIQSHSMRTAAVRTLSLPFPLSLSLLVSAKDVSNCLWLQCFCFCLCETNAESAFKKRPTTFLLRSHIPIAWIVLLVVAFLLKSDSHLATICRSNWCLSLYFPTLCSFHRSLAVLFQPLLHTISTLTIDFLRARNSRNNHMLQECMNLINDFGHH